MFYTIHSRELGRVVLHLDTIYFSGFFVYISGYDDDHNRINFTMDRFIFPAQERGWCHVISYVIGNAHTSCSAYYSFI